MLLDDETEVIEVVVVVNDVLLLDIDEVEVDDEAETEEFVYGYDETEKVE